jgi:nuclear transport factor 2 (NTF2) superfamily protein
MLQKSHIIQDIRNYLSFRDEFAVKRSQFPQNRWVARQCVHVLSSWAVIATWRGLVQVTEGTSSSIQQPLQRKYNNDNQITMEKK